MSNKQQQSETTAPDTTETAQTSDVSSLAPQVMSGEELDAEDLAVLPGRGSTSWSNRLLPVGAIAALLLLLGYVSTRGGSEVPAGPAPAAAAALPMSAEGKAPADTPEASSDRPAAEQADEQAPETEGEGQASRQVAFMPGMHAAAPAEDGDERAPSLPGGPSTARFPDLPPAVISYLKKVEAEQSRSSAAASIEAP
jgi:hypothetical protein